MSQPDNSRQAQVFRQRPIYTITVERNRTGFTSRVEPEVTTVEDLETTIWETWTVLRHLQASHERTTGIPATDVPEPHHGARADRKPERRAGGVTPYAAFVTGFLFGMAALFVIAGGTVRLF